MAYVCVYIIYIYIYIYIHDCGPVADISVNLIELGHDRQLRTGGFLGSCLVEDSEASGSGAALT